MRVDVLGGGRPIVTWVTLLLTAMVLMAPGAQGQAFRQATRNGAPASKHVTVDQVIGMVNAGLSDDVIIARLRKEDKAFDLTPDDMIRLKNAKVSDAVMKVMLDPQAAPAAPAPPSPPATVITMPVMPGVSIPGASSLVPKPSGATPAPGVNAVVDQNDPLQPHDSGIYLYTKDRAGKPQMIVLERASYQGAKSGGMLGYSMTYGLKKMKTKAVIPGTRAGIRVQDAAPVFYFYFDDKQAGLGKTYFGMSNLSNPNQFALLRLEVKKSDRETVIGQMGALGTSSGSDANSMVPFKSERIRAGLYKVSIDQIRSGEYCFMGTSGPQVTGMAAAYGGVTGATDLFDFGADVN